MSLAAVFLPEAEDDIAEVHAYYEAQRAGLGNEFTVALNEVLDRIRVHPQMYGIFRRDIRAAILKRFPYVVYYRDRETDILVIAVQHGRRSSRGLRGRL